MFIIRTRLIFKTSTRHLSTLKPQLLPENLNINGVEYPADDYTNITPKILKCLNVNLHTQPKHPLGLVKQNIVDYFYRSFRNARGNPLFSIYDNINPIVTAKQNFDSLLVPADHPSRLKSDCYYLNRNYLLRAHTTAHQSDLIRAGLDSFLVVGDVYRRDEIDSTHYPVFHQVDGVKLYTRDQLFPKDDQLKLFEKGSIVSKQGCHTLEVVKVLEHELKSSLSGLANSIFGDTVESRWVESQFPFTNPSWELEVKLNNDWLEVLGCGIIRQEILNGAGVQDQVGWAFGLGLERIAMKLYSIPDIRLFWSKDSGFLNQFAHASPKSQIIYKPISVFPQCTSDISFWLPDESEFNSNDFYDLVRNIGGDIVEQVSLFDKFVHPKKNRTSHSYRIVYRHMEKTLTQKEVNLIQKLIAEEAIKKLGVELR